MLTNSLKISDITKKEFFELTFFQSVEKIIHWKKQGENNYANIMRVFNGTTSNATIPYRKVFSEFFPHIPNLYKISNTLKKRWASDMICFWNDRLQKAGLLKSLKSPVLKYLWTVNISEGPKHCLNLHRSVFVVFFDHSQKNSARKTLF